MTRRRDEIVGCLIVAASLVYLVTFVPRGWVPHDEGMLGQSAERVLLGQMPHVDYEEPYTGGLSLLHAAVFRVFGTDLVNLRWLLFAAFVGGQIVLYAILKRFLDPIGAAFASALALTWSVPNYFASLPSWWVLLCAVTCLWAFIRYVETESLRYAALAGVAAGMAMLFKQTGLYVLIALVMALMQGIRQRAIRAAVALGSIAVAFAVLRPRLAAAESLYLLMPIVACAFFLLADTCEGNDDGTTPGPAAVAAGGAALPLLAGVVPYLMGSHIGTLVNGLFILPQRRLEFASLPMEHAYFLLAGAPCVALVSPLANKVRLTGRRTRIGVAVLSIIASALIVASFDRYAAYQAFWQSGRAFAALLPVVVSGLLVVGRPTKTRTHAATYDEATNHEVRNSKRRRILFAVTVMLAWASLVQFPFSGAIYFCYAVPLAVVAGAASAKHFSAQKHPALAVWCAALMVFAVLTMNRGYLDSLGAWHAPVAMTHRLDLPRAHLTVKAEEAATYRRVVELVTAHLGNGQLVAGPDSPEVYFLLKRLNPSGVFFDFFTGGPGGEDDETWSDARVVVLNHRPGFSPAPNHQFAAEIRRTFPHGESIGKFEVRWR